MDTPWIQIVSQSGVYAAFLLYLIWAWRRGAAEWAPVLSACVYAVLFEHWNMLRYARVQGGYHYHTDSWLWICGDVPLYIPLAWSMILATSRALTDHLGLRRWARPFCDALLALLIDLSMDAVAIRLKFWYWHGVGWNDAFFGVPADNFVGWLLVSFTFSALTRWLWSGSVEDRWKIAAQIGVIPLVAYVSYLGLEAIVHVQYHLFHAESLRGQLFVLTGTVVLFAGVVFVGARWPGVVAGDKTRAARDHLPAPIDAPAAVVHGPRHIFHLFGLIGLFCLPAGVRVPGLWILAGAVWLAEWTIALFAARCARRNSERIGSCR
jgi:uncharacterized membrane protein